ncbi:DUF905 family protein [Escherichia coli]|uniref:DUF905 family protein n=1 Tax=Escherichia coli TaxID=562 RepID=UPI00098AF24A|nr:DUF905 family protein [Escherichia coli]
MRGLTGGTRTTEYFRIDQRLPDGPVTCEQAEAESAQYSHDLSEDDHRTPSRLLVTNNYALVCRPGHSDDGARYWINHLHRTLATHM